MSQKHSHLLSATIIITILLHVHCSNASQSTSEDKPVLGNPSAEVDVSRSQGSTQSNLPQSDHLYPNNTKMIQAFSGEKTQHDWFLRGARNQHRVMTIQNGLNFYLAQFGSFPSSWEEFEKSGFYSFGALDPIDEKPVSFNAPPSADDDFINLLVTPDPNHWKITGRTADKDGKWIQADFEFKYPEGGFYEVIQGYRDMFPTLNAMLGRGIAENLSAILIDYENRRHEFPSNSSQLMDGLWFPNYEWAKYDDTVNPDTPGSLIFGVDDKYPKAVARWVDDDGTVYVEAWSWSEMPTGWNGGPYTVRTEGNYGTPTSPPGSSYVPSVILWKCRIHE